MNRDTARRIVSNGNTNTTNLRQEILARLLDGKRHAIHTLGTSYPHSVRGRLAELRQRGFNIVHANGYVQLIGFAGV